MVSKEVIEDIKNRLVKVYNPIAIYRFSSHEWGKTTEECDLDLLIVVDKSEEKPFRRTTIGYNALCGLEYLSKDLIVQTKDEFEQRSSKMTTLEYKIKTDGELLYMRA